MSNAFDAPHFTNDEAARKLIESIRWPAGPVCSHCGTIGHAYAVKGRAGLYRCAEKECRKDFTCTTGTVMERSKIPLHKWMMAFYLMNASKKGVSSHQLHRALGITYQSAWFMTHRIREAMRDGGFSPLGGEGKIVEADETYYGPVETPRESPQRKGRPLTKGGQTVRATSAPSLR
jgi:transposase-like protein